MLIENHEFNEIYEKYKNLVLKVAYQVSGDLQAAEDIMQDIFLTLYKEQGTEYRNIKAWLCLKAKHRALIKNGFPVSLRRTLRKKRYHLQNR